MMELILSKFSQGSVFTVSEIFDFLETQLADSNVCGLTYQLLMNILPSKTNCTT